MVARGHHGDGTVGGFASVLLYIAIYSFMTLGAFALIGMLRPRKGKRENIEDYAGLAKLASRWRRSSCWSFWCPWPVFLRPAGFIGKFYIFHGRVNGGMTNWQSWPSSSPRFQPSITCAS